MSIHVVDAKIKREKDTTDEAQSQDGYYSFRVLKQFDKAFGEDVETTTLSRQTLLNEYGRTYRQYNIDLTPKIIFSKSKSVDLMIRSGVANYLEF